MTEKAKSGPAEGSESGEVTTSYPPALEGFTRELVKKSVAHDYIKSEHEVSAYRVMATYLKDHFDTYFTREQRSALRSVQSDDVSYDGLFEDSSLFEALKGFKSWDDPAKVEEVMGKLRPCFAALVSNLEGLQETEDVLQNLESLKSHYGDLSDEVPEVATVLGEVNGYLSADPSDTAEMADKYKAWKSQLEGSFTAFKTAKVDELKGKTGVTQAKLDELQAISVPKDFLAEFAAYSAELEQQPETPETASEEPEDTEGDGNADTTDPSAIATQFGEELDKTGNAGSALLNMTLKGGFVGMLAGFAIKMLRQILPDTYDKLFEGVESSDTMEVYADLETDGHISYKQHEATDEAWLTHRELQVQATTWFQEQLQVGSNPVGNKPELASSLFNSNFTVGNLKDIAERGSHEGIIEEEDLPPKYQDDLEVIRAVHKAVTDKLGNDTDHDGDTLAKYVVESELYEEASA